MTTVAPNLLFVISKMTSKTLSCVQTCVFFKNISETALLSLSPKAPLGWTSEKSLAEKFLRFINATAIASPISWHVIKDVVGAMFPADDSFFIL